MGVPFQFIFQAALSLAIGGLIGLERGKQMNHPLLGVRTFALVSLLGLLLTVIPFQPDVALPAIGLFGVFVFSFLYYYFKAIHFKGAWGLTTALMLPFVFFLSVLVGKGFLFEAGVAAIVATFLLVEKKEVHKITNTVSKLEIVDALIFAIIAFIIYPRLPEAPVSFLGQSISLKFFWSIVVVISLVAFIAHLLLKYARRKALFYSSVLGGMISSLGVLALFVRDTRDPRILRSVFVNSSLGSLASDALLFAVIAPVFLVETALFFAIALLACIAASFLEYAKAASIGHLISPDKRPLSLKFTFEFAFIFFLVSLFVSWASSLSQDWLLLASFIGGIASSTSVFASIAYLHASQGVSTRVAVEGLAVASVASLAVKAALLYARTGAKARIVSKPLLIMLAGILLGLLANLFIRF